MSCKLRRTWASQTARARVLCPRCIIFVILQDPVASVSASSFRHDHQLKHSPLHHHLRSGAIVCGCIVGSWAGFVLIEVMTIRTWRLPESCISIGGKSALVFSMSVFLYVVGLRVVMIMRLALGALQIGRNERAARFALYNKLNEIRIWCLIPRKRTSEMWHVKKFV